MWNKASLFLFGCMAHVASAQQIHIQGEISDSISGEGISGVSVLYSKNDAPVLSDANGHFMLTFNTKQLTEGLLMRFVALGYQTKEVSLVPNQDYYEIILSPRTKVVKEVTVKASKDNLSSLNLPLALARKIPMLGGEADVIKAFQFMPGVASGGEGSSALPLAWLRPATMGCREMELCRPVQRLVPPRTVRQGSPRVQATAPRT